jgi:hypothetical protein
MRGAHNDHCGRCMTPCDPVHTPHDMLAHRNRTAHPMCWWAPTFVIGGGAYRRTTRLMDATEDAPARQRTMRVCATQSPIVGHGDRPALFSFYMNMVEPPGRTMPHDPCSCSEITQCATLMVCGDRNSHFPAHMMEPPDRCMHMTMSVHSNTSSAIMSRQQHMRIVA